MKDGLEFSVSMNEYVLSAILVTVLALGIGFEYAYVHHPVATPAPCPAVTVTAAATPPTIEIQQTIYVPVPAAAPQIDTPPTTVQPDDDTDPVFEHRTPIITDALRQPMVYAKNQ